MRIVLILLLFVSSMAFSQEENLKPDFASDNPYHVLGLEKEAGEKKAKKAYNKLAKIFHPDLPKNKGDIVAEDKFKTLALAYNSIKDKKPFKPKAELKSFGEEQISASFNQLYADLQGKNDIYLVEMVINKHSLNIGYMNDSQRFEIFELIKDAVKEGIVDGEHPREISEKVMDSLLHFDKEINIIRRNPSPITYNVGLDDMDRLNTRTYSRYIEYMGDVLTTPEVVETLNDYQEHRISLMEYKEQAILDDSVFNNMTKNSLKGRDLSLKEFTELFDFGGEKFSSKVANFTEGGFGYILETVIPNINNIEDIESLKPHIQKALDSKLMDKKGLKNAYFKKVSSLGKKFARCGYIVSGKI